MITFRNPALFLNAERFVEPAMVKPQIWRVISAIALMLLIYASFLFLLPLVSGVYWDSETVNQFMTGLDQLDTRPEVIFVLISFIGIIIGLVCAVFVFHNRGLSSMLGRTGLRSFIPFFLALAAVWVFQAASAFFGNFFITSEEQLIQQYSFDEWVKWIPVLLPLLLIQVSAEELVFRGYLQQQLAALSKNRWIWWILPSVLFGAMHFESSTFGSNVYFVVAVTGIIGLIAADLTMRTGTLWAAIGLHFGNNFSGLGIIGQKGHLSGFSMFISPTDLSDEAAVRPFLIAQLVCAVVALLVYLFVANKIRQD